jgi:hypothetical protein
MLRREPHHEAGTNVTPTTQNPPRLLQTGQALGLRDTGAFTIRRRAIFTSSPLTWVRTSRRDHLPAE